MFRVSNFQSVGCIILFFLVIGTSCTSVNQLQPPSQLATVNIPLYRPETEMPEYRIGINDELEIKFFDNEKFNEKVIVRPDGRISLQRIDEIYVNGMTPSALDKLITQTYAEIIKEPDITVFVRNCSRSQIYLMGEVNTPGAYPLQNGLTLIQALSLARWETGDANLKSVVLLRRTNEKTMTAQIVNIKKLIHTGPQREDIVLQADDVIYVPKTFIADLGHFIRSYYDIILPPWQAFWQIQYIEARLNN